MTGVASRLGSKLRVARTAREIRVGTGQKHRHGSVGMQWVTRPTLTIMAVFNGPGWTVEEDKSRAEGRERL